MWPGGQHSWTHRDWGGHWAGLGGTRDMVTVTSVSVIISVIHGVIMSLSHCRFLLWLTVILVSVGCKTDINVMSYQHCCTVVCLATCVCQCEQAPTHGHQTPGTRTVHRASSAALMNSDVFQRVGVQLSYTDIAPTSTHCFVIQGSLFPPESILTVVCRCR